MSTPTTTQTTTATEVKRLLRKLGLTETMREYRSDLRRLRAGTMPDLMDMGPRAMDIADALAEALD